MTPSEDLRAAAEKIRTLRAALPDSDWGDRPWHVEECASEMREDCPCIVAQGEGKPWDQPQVPLIHYVADAETPQHADWIAAMHPGVGLALAAWLDDAARGCEASVAAADDVFRDDPQGRERFLSTGPGAPNPHALAVARAILGSGS